MGLEIKQSLKLSQQLVMTPQLQQAIKLLQLSRLELADTIQQELLENPLLEISEDSVQEQEREEAAAQGEPMAETSEAPESGDRESTDAGGDEPSGGEFDEISVGDQVKEDFDWENYLGEYSSAPMSGESQQREDKDTPSFEAVLSRAPSLREHLLWQLQLSALSEDDMRVGEMIICNLNPDGYLTSSLEEMARMAEVPVERMERLLKVIQQMDPLGVGARDLRECLLIQATEYFPADDLLHQILEDHLPDLERHNYKAVAKELDVTQDDVLAALDRIRTLEPKPGRSVSDEQTHYITPDIYVYKVDGQWVIQLNEDGLPKLRVNSFYREALANSNSGSDAKEFVQNKLRGALWLIRSIHQRQRTIYKVTEAIVHFQQDFLEKGIAKLKPLVLRDVAEEVGMHESTISRVTTNKYVHTPQGVFELKFFFNSGINRVQGEAVASEAVKDRIRQLITAEDSAHPLSDQTIADLLEKENIAIARRTVAKYREMLNILPSSRRRNPGGKSRSDSGKKGR